VQIGLGLGWDGIEERGWKGNDNVWIVVGRGGVMICLVTVSGLDSSKKDNMDV